MTTTTAEERLRGYLNRALSDLRAARAELAERDARDSEPMALIGMACRLPAGIGCPEELWDALVAGRDLVGEFPAGRGWQLEDFYDPSGGRPGSTYVKTGSFLEDVSAFDAEFFGISPREAAAMDPQQRLLLQVTWEALENAGIDPQRLRGSRTGVFLGATSFDYGRLSSRVPEDLEGNILIGRSGAIASGRIAYVMDWRGPALTIDTMCSSSLVALHEACASLRAGDCDLAVVCGSAVLSTPEGFTEFSRQNALAADGRCKAFSEDADGTGWAEGVGVVVVEPAVSATEQGHEVLALIRGSATNQDGASNGLTAPSGDAQRDVIRQALLRARVSAAEVDLVEAHGTGTRLGDPIEAHALLDTYGAAHTADRPLWLGSHKSNLGHAASAAGVIGVIKAVLALRHRWMPPTLHAARPSGAVDWSRGHVRLLTQGRRWPDAPHPARVAVSAFGASGTNAHVVLEEAPPGTPAQDLEPLVGGHLLMLSARSPQRVRAAAGRLRSYLTANGRGCADDLPAIAWSLARGRHRFDHSAFIALRDGTDVVEALAAVAAGQDRPGVVVGQRLRGRPRVVFVFPGQGAQWAGMARGLLGESRAFRTELAACDEALGRVGAGSVTSLLEGDDTAWLERVDLVQPALWAVMVALAGLWRRAGVCPDVVVGHSQGEIAAAAVAGILDLTDAALVVVERARAVARLGGSGGMLAVGVPAAEASELLARPEWSGLSLAAVNSTRQCVVAGPADVLEDFGEFIRGSDRMARTIPVGYASHTGEVDVLRAELLTALAGIRPREGSVPLLSSVTASPMKGEELGPEYWFRNLREPVRLADVTNEVSRDEPVVFVEVSPHPVLGLALETSVADLERAAAVVGTLHRGEGDSLDFLHSVAAAGVAGIDPDSSALSGTTRKVPLPTYPWAEGHYWLPLNAEDPRSRPADERSAFYEAARAGEVGRLAEELGVPANRLDPVVTAALGRWDVRCSGRERASRWAYRIEWRPSTPSPVSLTGHWVVIGAALTETLGSAVVEAIRYAGGEAEVVPDVATLGGLLAQEPIEGIVVTGDSTPVTSDCALSVGLQTVVDVLRRVAEGPGGIRVWVATRGACPANLAGLPAREVAHASAMWALGRVAALEHPRIWGGLIDVGEHADPALLASALAGTEDQVAVTAAGLRVRRLARHTRRGRPWDLSGTALLVGGTGAIGRQVATWLAGRGCSRVVLVARRGPATPGLDETMLAVQERGASIRVVAGEAADAGLLRDIVKTETESGHPVATVWHLAGGGVLRPLATEQPESMAATMHAKVMGAGAIDVVFRTPDVPVVLFGSISATWGSADHGAYAAANGWLAGLAERRLADGLPTLCLDWGIWDPARGGGMASALSERLLHDRGVPFMDPDLALAALADALCDGPAHSVIADIEWERFAPVFTGVRPCPLLEDFLTDDTESSSATTGAPEDLRSRLAHLPPGRRQNVLAESVARHVVAVLKLPAGSGLDPARPFREIGFDSLTALNLRRRLQGLTGLKLPATIVFDFPTLERLTNRLLTLLGVVDEVPARPAPAAVARPMPESTDVDLLDAEDLVRRALSLTGSAESELQ